MTRSFACAAVVGVVVMVVPATARQDPISEEEYEATMKEIRFSVSDARGHIDARYWPELETEVGRLRGYFGQIEAFWSARGNDGASGLAQEALAAVEGIDAAAAAEDQSAARDAVKTLQATCGSCHMQFREETADGYRIKP